MRNILLHDYDDVNPRILWDTAQDDLPVLIARLESYLAVHPPEDEPPPASTSS